ncbi:universal stress protein [Ostreiculturibacter nitratireducens]|uniref:universal stress protein n=1 Tax=Ostreiculturibacter nitratireducens TaxID=3075226 RepID=UPI0031B5A2DB
MTRKILVAYDGSDNSRRALELASELSAKLEMDLTILHVMMHGKSAEEILRLAEAEHIVREPAGDAAEKLRMTALNMREHLGRDPADAERVRAVSAIGDQLVAEAQTMSDELGARNVRTMVRSGDYAEEILEAAKETGADMVVVGSRGLGLIKGALLGSVSMRVAERAYRTVVTVR